MLSVLPYSHIYEHTLIYIYLLAKVRYFICHDPNELLAGPRDVRPVEMTAVPRIFDRVLAGVKGPARGSTAACKATLVPWALAVGRDTRTRRPPKAARALAALQYASPSASCLSKIRTRARPRPRAVSHQRKRAASYRYRDDVPGARHSDHARLRPHRDLAGRLGEPAFGRTSTVRSAVRSPASTSRSPQDGEVLVRGRNVMQGYYRDAEATAAALATAGCIPATSAKIDGAGFLRITDRKNEIFKTGTRQVDLTGADRGQHQAFDLRRARDGHRQRPRRIRSR